MQSATSKAAAARSPRSFTFCLSARHPFICCLAQSVGYVHKKVLKS